MLEQEAKRLDLADKARLAQAWYTAAFVRARKMPRLGTLLGVQTTVSLDEARLEHEMLLAEIGEEE